MTLALFAEILMLLVPVELFLGIAVSVYFYNNLQKPYRDLTFYLIICLVTDLSSRLAGSLLGNNLFFFIIFSIFEILFFYYFYRKHCSTEKKKLLKIIVYVAVVFMLGEFYILLDTKPVEFQTYSRSLSSFVIMVIIFNYLFKLAKSNQLNWVQLKYNSILVIYCSINLILFLPFNFLINVPSPIKFYFWIFNLMITAVFYALIITEIWKNGLKRKQLQHG